MVDLGIEWVKMGCTDEDQDVHEDVGNGMCAVGEGTRTRQDRTEQRTSGSKVGTSREVSIILISILHMPCPCSIPHGPCPRSCLSSSSPLRPSPPLTHSFLSSPLLPIQFFFLPTTPPSSPTAIATTQWQWHMGYTGRVSCGERTLGRSLKANSATHPPSIPSSTVNGTHAHACVAATILTCNESGWTRNLP